MLLHPVKLAASLLLAAAVAAVALPAEARADAVDDYIRAQMARNHIPAASVAVIQGGEVVKLAAYGVANLEWDARATPRTTFQLASATKPFTGLLLMQLVEEGKISLDAPLTTFFPDAPDSWKRVTVRHLAAHTSGLPDTPELGALDSVEKVVAGTMKQPLSHEPGARSVYGFTDYVVLTAILEKAAGKPFPVLLRERIVQPLGLRSTAFNNEQEQGPIRFADPLKERAEVYQWQAGSQKAFRFLYGIPGYAAGGLYSSAADLASLFQALETGKLLRPESKETMWTRPKLPGGGQGDFGLGWVVGTYHGYRTVGHSGGPALSDLLYFPDRGLAVVVLTNQQRLFPYLAEGVADLYLPAYTPPKSIPDTDPALTARLKHVLTEAAEGRADTDALAPAARAELIPTLQQAGPMVLGVFDPIRQLDLMEEHKEAGNWTRKYRVWFGKAARYWQFTLTPEGKVASLQPASE